MQLEVPPKPTTLIIGASGMLGYGLEVGLTALGHRVLVLNRNVFDVLKDPIKKIAPTVFQADLVVNATGIIKSMCDRSTKEETLFVNGVFPRNLARLTNSLGKQCIHVTTDCAYKGTRGGYDEHDDLDADDFYGMSKIAGEAIDCMVIRTSIIGEERHGRQRSLLEWTRSCAGGEITGYTNHFWNGLTTTYLAEVISSICLSGSYSHGLFHIHSPADVSKHELLGLIGEIYQLNLHIRPIEVRPGVDRTLRSIHPLSTRFSTAPIASQIEKMRVLFASTRVRETA